FVFSVHPLQMLEPSVRTLPCPIIHASDLAQHIGRKVWVLGWPITRKEVVTKEGEPMEFVSFEDRTAIYETVFFPETFKRFCQDLDTNRAYLLHGRVESEFDTVSLAVDRLRRILLAGKKHDSSHTQRQNDCPSIHFEQCL
ncbi:MAG: OB-fold nucleic acid binding domain-containing protein, partial [Desulfoferrobacter sp.]